MILHGALPGHYFGGYPFIPTYFYLFGLFSIYMFDTCRQHAPQKMLLLYLAIKMVKMILSIILVLKMCIRDSFNPVDLVCAVRDYKGHKFDLVRFVDKATGFISYKSKNGKDLKALELPCLWNGRCV